MVDTATGQNSQPPPDPNAGGPTTGGPAIDAARAAAQPQDPGQEPATVNIPTSASEAMPTTTRTRITPGGQQQPVTTVDAVTPPPRVNPPDWGQRVYRNVLNALSGTNNIIPERDPATGKMTYSVTRKEPGQQWKEIIAGALSGIANMGDVGTGPGQQTRALSAGVRGGINRAQKQEGLKNQQANEDWEATQKQLTDSAQRTMLATQNTAMQLRMAREEVTAHYEDAKFSEQQRQWMEENGATDLGVAPDMKTLLEMHHNDPKLMQAHTLGQIVPMPVVENGKYAGTHFMQVSPQFLNQRIDRRMPLNFYVPPKPGEQEGHVETEWMEAGTISNGDYLKTKMALDKPIQEADDKRHQYSLEEEANKARMLAADAEVMKAHAEMRKADLAGSLGTWEMAYAGGKPIFWNRKTLETRAAPTGLQTATAYAKTQQDLTKATTSIDEDMTFANDYVNSKKFDGPSDEALLERYFDLTKPQTGFRMSQPQIKMLTDARSWKNSIQGYVYHQMHGTWFPPEQRKQIVGAMQKLADAKRSAAAKAYANGTLEMPQETQFGLSPSAGAGGTGAAPAPPKPGDVVDGFKFKGGPASDPNSWEPVVTGGGPA